MTKVELSKRIREFIQAQDDNNKEERYETDKETAEDVLCKFLQSLNMPVWKVTLIYADSIDELRLSVQRFVLESTADTYIAETQTRQSQPNYGGYKAKEIKKEFKI